MITDIQIAVLALVWLDDKQEVIKLDDLKKEYFEGLEDMYDIVMKYRKDGHPFDITISRQKIGDSISQKLAIALSSCGGLTVYENYMIELKQYYFGNKMYRCIKSNNITKQDLEEGIRLLTPKRDNLNRYNLTGNLSEYIEDLDKRGSEDQERYKTFIKVLDDTLGFLLPGMLVTIGGLPGTGKTNFALRLFSNMVSNKIPSLFLSSEMGYFQLIDRLVSMNSNVSAMRLRNGLSNDIEKNEILETVKKIEGSPGYIDEIARFELEDIKSSIDELKIKVVFIDFLQMFRLQGETRASAMSEITTSLKEIAMDKKVVVFALSQVNKDMELKESRGIEEKSDIVIKMHTTDEDYDIKTVRVNVTKNRYGLTNGIDFGFKKHNCGFAPLERRDND